MTALSMKSFIGSSFVVVVLFVVVLPSASNAHPMRTCMFDAIYQLGDSISDTGNLIRENPFAPFSRLPYGESFFNHAATGRCSNGLLIIDQFALASGLPLINPYLNKEAPKSNGVNFAVAGATALPTEVLAQNNIFSQGTKSSLTTQLQWMSSHFNTACSMTNQIVCAEKLKNALFFVGEIGGNDYNFALFQGKSIHQVKIMVPQVVRAIKDAVTKVISYGATRVIVPGNFPVGCIPIYLTRFQTKNLAAYDELHCLKDLNNFAMYHNRQLQEAIISLREENPHVIIVYADYYNALLWVIQHASMLGFDETSLQKSCCGIGGDYDFNFVRMCGRLGVPVCPNPEERISWDGIHSTQKTYRHMAYWLMHDIFPKLHCIL